VTNAPRAGLALIDELIKHDDHYQWTHSLQADLFRRLGQSDQARAAYQKVLSLSQQEPERRFLERRLQELEKK
jgi:RNA polymerase sigma-70 factor (ECF subfamily)